MAQPQHSWFTAPTGFVHGTCFNLASALLIVSNAVFIGIQTHIHLQTLLDDRFDLLPEDYWRPWELSFLVAFVLELGLRIANDRVMFCRGVEWRWNLFDSIIVGVSVIETVAESILVEVGVNFPFLRLVRVVRVLRVLKVLHMVPFFRRLGLMMTSVSASLSALAPAFVLLILLMYLFGICILQGIIHYVANHYVGNDAIEPEQKVIGEVQRLFGSVDTTMRTLFMSVTGGVSWAECVLVLQEMGPMYDMVFMFYVAFVQICVLNIVTGVFVDTVHQMYRPEREEMVERESAKRKQVLNLVRSIFEDADEDGSGTITWKEFSNCLSDEQIVMYLASLEIDITQAREIFDAIDYDNTNEVSIDEVVIGLLEMKGAAKGADLLILRNNVNKLSHRVAHFIHDSTKAFDKLNDHLELYRKDFYFALGHISPNGKSDAQSYFDI